jgi:hypothetical protein
MLPTRSYALPASATIMHPTKTDAPRKQAGISSVCGVHVEQTVACTMHTLQALKAERIGIDWGRFDINNWQQIAPWRGFGELIFTIHLYPPPHTSLLLSEWQDLATVSSAFSIQVCWVGWDRIGPS